MAGEMTNLDFITEAHQTYGIDGVEYVNVFFFVNMVFFVSMFFPMLLHVVLGGHGFLGIREYDRLVRPRNILTTSPPETSEALS